jgi:hypothetical protein
MKKSGTHPRRLWRSTGAIFLGFAAVFFLSLGTAPSTLRWAS